ncbi:IclR family transcriptional regulator [Lentzea sp. NPDC003310]|uniref:IclR family transcriptional regulator n=1 Tax=Lentzea sp. NPDC003310 TaxID=3154447 RepID=UPI0033AAD90C
MDETKTIGEPVLERAFRVLRTFGAEQRPLSLTSLSARSGLPKSTVLRLTRTLVRLGALERCAEGGYTIGLGLWELATLAPRAEGLRARALPFMRDLHVSTGQHVVLSVLDGVEAVITEMMSAPGAVRTRHRVGSRFPLHATAQGQSLLANGPVVLQEQVLAGELVPVPENVPTCPQRLRARLASVRNQGVAVVSCAVPEAHTAVAAPVVDQGGRAIASLAVVVRSPGCNVPALRAAVMATCNAMNQSIRSTPVRGFPDDPPAPRASGRPCG